MAQTISCKRTRAWAIPGIRMTTTPDTRHRTPKRNSPMDNQSPNLQSPISNLYSPTPRSPKRNGPPPSCASPPSPKPRAAKPAPSATGRMPFRPNPRLYCKKVDFTAEAQRTQRKRGEIQEKSSAKLPTPCVSAIGQKAFCSRVFLYRFDLVAPIGRGKNEGK